MKIKSKVCSEFATARITRWCGFLATTRGRGLFLLVLALVSLATVTTNIGAFRSYGAYVEYMNIGAAAFLLLVGLFNLAVGTVAEYQLGRVRSRWASEAAVRDVFRGPYDRRPTTTVTCVRCAPHGDFSLCGLV